MTVSAAEFVARWKDRNLTERQSAHTHFLDLCDLLGVDKPLHDRTKDRDYLFDAVTASPGSKTYAAAMKAKVAEAEGTGSDGQAGLFPGAPVYVSAPEGSYGWVDVWKRGHFCWEYKRPGKGHKSITAALAQLKTYKDSLDNPPLLIVCDIDRYEIHTNFTGHPTKVHRFTVDDLAVVPEEWKALPGGGVSPLQALRYAFTNPEWFRPKETVEDVTQEIAEKLGVLAREAEQYKGENGKSRYERYAIAHLLMQLVFAMFAERIDLLPKDTVRKLCEKYASKPGRWVEAVRGLLSAMAKGGMYGDEEIAHFNGGLYRDVDTQVIPEFNGTHIGALQIIAGRNWSAIEPSIIGTLFERSLDEKKRAQQGAQFTGRSDIMLIVEPVMVRPLREEWSKVQASVASLLKKKEAARSDKTREEAHVAIADALKAFGKRLAEATVLDPACGSGNFLYVSLQCLLDLEKEVIAFGARPEIGVGIKPAVSPLQLRGIELDPFAAELARVSVWIGYLKWKRENGEIVKRRPILDKLDTIENRDAIVDHLKGKGTPVPARWPKADFIVGNPPFLGGKYMREHGMSDDYLEELFSIYDIPNTSDLVCYWFERGRQEIERNDDLRIGFIATQGIRGGDNRTVLSRIKETGDIFMAWSARDWTLDGAAVQVSMVGFSGRSSALRLLDGSPVDEIHPDLSSGVNLTLAREISENQSIAFMGDTKGGPFDISLDTAISLLVSPNPHRRANSDVVVPWINGRDMVQRPRGMWIVDFGVGTPMEGAAMYEAPFRHVERLCKAARKSTRQEREAEQWWLHVRPRAAMRNALAGLPRFLFSTNTAKHRTFVWVRHPILPDHAGFVFARSDDYFMGTMHSSVHEVWGLALGTQLEDRPRFTATTSFETFPLPWPPGKEPTEPKAQGHALWKAIGEAARKLNELREEWLNPTDRLAWHRARAEARYAEELAALESATREQVIHSAIMAAMAEDKVDSRRTLTNLYNERPAWLRLAHKKLDRAVLAAYGAVDPEGEWPQDWADVFEPLGAGEIPEETLKLKKDDDADRVKAAHAERAAQREAVRAAREPVIERILANLLRMNLARPAVNERKVAEEEENE